MPLRWARFPDRFTIVVLFVGVVLMVAELVNGRFWLNDFRVYYDAATALRQDQPLYGVAHGLSSGFFKYAPVMALAYVPLSWLPYTLAAVIQYALIVAAFIHAVIVVDRLVRTHVFAGKPQAFAPLFLLFATVVVHLHRELHLGNINVLLVWLLVNALDHLLSGRRSTGGMLIGIAMLAKPHFAVLLPLLVLRGQNRAWTHALGIVVGGLALPMLFLGVGRTVELLVEWIGEMAKHNASLIYTGGSAYNNVDTLYSFLHRSVLHRFGLAGSNTEAAIVLAVVAVLFGALVLVHRAQEKRHAGGARHFLMEYLLLMALVPSITLTDTNHFLFSAPMILLIIHRLVPKADAWWAPFVAIPLLLGYGGNWADALGDWSDTMVHYGILGIANCGLVVLAVRLYQRSNLPGTSAS